MYYGNPEVTSGGIALKFFASVRLEIRPIGKIKSVSTNICTTGLYIYIYCLHLYFNMFNELMVALEQGR